MTETLSFCKVLTVRGASVSSFELPLGKEHHFLGVRAKHGSLFTDGDYVYYTL